MPVRTLAQAARLIREARQLPRYGIAGGEPSLDYLRLLARVREVTAAALRELPGIGPRTVVWLNEAQFYLADAELGERVATGLRELLRDPAGPRSSSWPPCGQPSGMS